MILTVVCVFLPAGRWCYPGVSSALCPVLPAVSRSEELLEQSPNGHAHVAPLLASSAALSSAGAQVETQTL